MCPVAMTVSNLCRRELKGANEKTIAPLDLEHAKGFPTCTYPNSRNTAHRTLKKGLDCSTL